MSSTEQSILNSMQQLSVQSGNSGPPEKPTQVVTPAINRSQPSASKITPVKPSTVSPAIATIDRLLSLGTSVPPPPPVITRAATDMDPHTVEQLRAVKEMLTAQEEEAQSLRDINRELRDRLEECETKIKKLTDQNEEYAEKEKALSQRVAEKVRNNKQMSVVMEEYERTISSLIGEREAETKRWTDERSTLLRERDEAAAHLASMEHAFNDVHTKYERCKVIIQGYKSNEETLKRTVEENNDAIQKLEARYETLRQHAMQQLNKANAELDSVKKAHQAEILKLNAMLKKSEVHASSLQESLAQKIKDNEELTAICDELINKFLGACFSSGLRVGIVCDGDGTNTKSINILGSTTDHPYFEFKGQEIVTTADPPHLLKCFRNNFMKHNIEYTRDTAIDGRTTKIKCVAKWSHIEEFFKLDNENPNFVFAPALTKTHLQPNGK